MTVEEAIQKEYEEVFIGWTIDCFLPQDRAAYGIILTAILKVEHKGDWWTQVGMKRSLVPHPRLTIIVGAGSHHFIESEEFKGWIRADIDATAAEWEKYKAKLPKGYEFSGMWDKQLHPEHCTTKHVGGEWVDGTMMDDNNVIHRTQKYTGWTLNKPVVPTPPKGEPKHERDERGSGTGREGDELSGKEDGLDPAAIA
jgi:hypothetical protein